MGFIRVFLVASEVKCFFFFCMGFGDLGISYGVSKLLSIFLLHYMLY